MWRDLDLVFKLQFQMKSNIQLKLRIKEAQLP